MSYPLGTGAPLILSVSPVRRAIGTGLLIALGLILLWIALDRPPEAIGWRLFLLLFGSGALWLAVRLWRATAGSLRLTEDALVDTEGRVLARLDEIERIDSGVFAIKPSNGFTLRLRAPAGRAWAPGLWWRIGRSVGVGGVTNRDEARYMAGVLTALLSSRSRGS